MVPYRRLQGTVFLTCQRCIIRFLPHVRLLVSVSHISTPHVPRLSFRQTLHRPRHPPPDRRPLLPLQWLKPFHRPLSLRLPIPTLSSIIGSHQTLDANDYRV